MAGPGFHIRKAVAADAPEWARMRRALWPEETEGEHDGEIRAYLAGPGSAVTVTFVAERVGGGLAGFLELGLRSYAEGCVSQPVPYIEGWHVDADMRRRGVGRALVRAAEAWALDAGYREIGSDAELVNDVSHAAHRALGFEEVARTVSFRRALRPDAPR